jgi:hypothetical protein
MPRQPEFTRAALDRRDDLVGDVLMDVEALLLGHSLFSSGLVAAAATLPVGETGGSWKPAASAAPRTTSGMEAEGRNRLLRVRFTTARPRVARDAVVQNQNLFNKTYMF